MPSEGHAGPRIADIPVPKGYQPYHNYIRPLESLGGTNPSEMAGIKIEGANKWQIIIQNAAHQPRGNRENSQPEQPLS